MDWQPISEMRLWDKILAAENRMDPAMSRLWEAIRITPEKWIETSYGTSGGGFWVVAIIGCRAVWFNDIEDGFNCSRYTVYGKLAEYSCDQDELEVAVQNIMNIIETGRDSAPKSSPPVAGEWQPT